MLRPQRRPSDAENSHACTAPPQVQQRAATSCRALPSQTRPHGGSVGLPAARLHPGPQAPPPRPSTTTLTISVSPYSVYVSAPLSTKVVWLEKMRSPQPWVAWRRAGQGREGGVTVGRCACCALPRHTKPCGATGDCNTGDCSPSRETPARSTWRPHDHRDAAPPFSPRLVTRTGRPGCGRVPPPGLQRPGMHTCMWCNPVVPPVGQRPPPRGPTSAAAFRAQRCPCPGGSGSWAPAAG